MRGGALVLAAGASRRFGSDKRQFLLNGAPLLAHCLQALQCAGLSYRICAAPGEAALLRNLSPLVTDVVECAGARQGMGVTLAQGVAACGDWDRLLVVLADMPGVRPDTYRAVYAALEEHPISRPVFRGKPGQPVGFTRQFFAELAALGGDVGGRELLRRHASRVGEVPVCDGGILEDVDRPPGRTG